jgi:hypothetical protein
VQIVRKGVYAEQPDNRNPICGSYVVANTETASDLFFITR